MLERDVKNFKHKIKKLEKENNKLALVQAADEQKKEIKAQGLGKLYQNSNRVHEFSGLPRPVRVTRHPQDSVARSL